MKLVDATTFRKEFSQILKAGEPVGITKNGKVVARLEFPAEPSEWDKVRAWPGENGYPYTASDLKMSRASVQAAQKRRDDLLRGINSTKSRNKG